MTNTPYLPEVARGCTMEEFMSESAVRLATAARASTPPAELPLPLEKFSSAEVENQLYVARKKLRELEHQRLGSALSNAESCAKIFYDTSRAQVMQLRQLSRELTEKYTLMLHEVLGWDPGVDGEVLKKHMLKELRMAIVCDGMSPSLPKEITPEQFLAQQIADLKQEIKLWESRLDQAVAVPSTTTPEVVED